MITYVEDIIVVKQYQFIKGIISETNRNPNKASN